MITGTSKYLSAKVADGTSNLKNTVEYCMRGRWIILYLTILNEEAQYHNNIMHV